jgi:hypothetical protein
VLGNFITLETNLLSLRLGKLLIVFAINVVTGVTSRPLITFPQMLPLLFSSLFFFFQLDFTACSSSTPPEFDEINPIN